MAAEHIFETWDGLIEALADDLSERLRDGAEARGEASFIATGGSTPAPLYDALSKRDLAWHRLWVTLSDERWVSPEEESSNQKLVCERLLKGRTGTRFVALKTPHETPAEAAAVVGAKITAMPRPFDVVLLGMGPDGHIASLFPGNPALAAGLDPHGKDKVIAVEAEGAMGTSSRISLTLSALLDARWIAILIRGQAKLKLIRAAKGLPVQALLNQTKVPVTIYWAP